MSDFCYGDEINTLCNNEFQYKDSMIIRPPNKKESKLAHKFIFVDTADLYSSDGMTFNIDFDETIKDIVEIELMSCQMPSYDSSISNTTPNIPQKYPYNANYILLNVENIDVKNYKISSNNNVQNCFARLPIPGTTVNVFFGRIKNFTNAYQFKPILQKLNKLVIKITDKNNDKLRIDNSNTTDFFKLNSQNNTMSEGNSIQLTFGITYQTTPDLFD
tara:strand:- start:92 stop:742 length:651 start_codon:yes stop_codon:yes gene_type:complete